MAKERLQKILARGGVASRRAAEQLIQAGRVRINGRVVTELGVKAEGTDRIELDGKRVVLEAPVYVLLHKPRGVVSTMSDPEGRPTVRDLLAEVGARVYPVGRLDFATSGVLLATNDGELAQALLHPRRGVPKTYVMKLQGTMQEGDIERWRKGIQLEDGMTLPADVKFLRHEAGKTWLSMTLREGRNQQIRRMGEATGFPVMRLARTSFAGIGSEDLRPGKWRLLTREELILLQKAYGVPKRVVAGVPKKVVPSRGRTRPTTSSARPSAGNGERSPRYGGGAPGRRSTEVRDDWGGGVHRGSSSLAEDEQPRGELGRGGRGGPTRTTGTGGGIKGGRGTHGEEGYRVRRGRRG